MSGGAMLPDFTEALQENASNHRSRRHNTAHNGTRRETILSLVEMLLASEEVSKRELTQSSSALTRY